MPEAFNCTTPSINNIEGGCSTKFIDIDLDLVQISENLQNLQNSGKMEVFSINNQHFDAGLIHLNNNNNNKIEDKVNNNNYNTFVVVPVPGGITVEQETNNNLIINKINNNNNNNNGMDNCNRKASISLIPINGCVDEQKIDLSQIIPPFEEKSRKNSRVDEDCEKFSDKFEKKSKETWIKILKEICFPFFLAGMGMVGAGLLLQHVKETSVFKQVPEFIVVVTPLLGLKGNLEMTLASRLSTLSNLGLLKSSKAKSIVFMGNIALTQVQATGVGFLASLVAMAMGRLDDDDENPFKFKHLILLSTSCIMTANIVSFILGSLMFGVIILTNKFGINPDNVATPIAAALGDVTTLGFLTLFGNYLHENNLASTFVCPLIIIVFLSLMIVWIWVASQEVNCFNVLKHGWTPIICAMLISSCGGKLLDKADHFTGLALYQPLINGIGGNLVSIQASRISTFFYVQANDNLYQPLSKMTVSSCFVSPIKVFFKDGIHSVAARVLLGLVIPGQIIFATLIHFTSKDTSYFSIEFYTLYVTACFIQVLTLLYIARILVNFLWVKEYDTDSWSIPFLTSIGDLMGTGLLFLAFTILENITK